MSIARHHAEWLSLVPVSGPFLSMPVLMEAFPQGLDAHDAEHGRLLRLAYEEWDDSFQKKNGDPSVHEAWIRFVLTKTLEFDESLLAERQAVPQTLHVELPEHGELLKPSIVLNDPSTKKARMLIRTYPRSQDLTSYVAGSRWKASPETRMTELLHGTGVRLGLVTNGEHWMLVDAPKGETTGYASWYASLWREEKITLQAFRTLLSMPRFFGVSEDDTIEALLTKSASNQQEVTDQLGTQVLRAVEVLIQSLDKADQDHGRELLEDVGEAVLYESALSVMMRLVFLFCAEERELIPTKPFPVYEQNYSVSTISKQLRDIADQHGEELLERRFDAWPRVLSAFRAVYGGLAHDDVYMPAYGGRLFDPDRFPFLEGRKSGARWQYTEATPLPVNNRTVLHLLEALQLLRVKVPGGGPIEARRISFRALDIEQIGHVYEGLLDHTAKRATEPTLGLFGKKEPEIPLQQLEQKREKGEKPFYELLKKECGSSRKWEKYLGAELDDRQERRLRTACANDEAVFERVKPFAGLLRDDSFGYPVVVAENSVFVTAGTDRRSSGTHYTPRILTEPIVQYTLEPLVYVGPAEGKPKSEWKLRSPAELLDLKICDMACGSGAFLVQVCRYLAARLLEAWDELMRQQPDTLRMTPEGEPATGAPDELLIPSDPDERTTFAMRIVAQRCIYGVDVNPLAVEMAKLSLWLLTMAKDKPFEFLDHNIRCGDSLVGLHDIEQLRHFSLKPDNDDTPLFKGPLDKAVEEAISLRLKLEDMPSNTVEHIKDQESLLKEAEDKIARLRCAADLLVSAEFWGDGPKDKQEKVRHAAVLAERFVENGPTKEFEEKAANERQGQKMFHWPLEFPEVIVERGGFDAFVGNPPFMGGTVATTHLSAAYMHHIHALFANWHGKSDLVAAFFRRAHTLLSRTSFIGYLSTSAIMRGETLDCGLQPLLATEGRVISCALGPRPWPGIATVEVICLALASKWSGSVTLNDRSVASITSDLREGEDSEGTAPFELTESFDAYLGAKISPQNLPLHADHELCSWPNARDFLSLLIGGNDLYGRADLRQSTFLVDPTRLSELEEDTIEAILNILKIETLDAIQHSAPARKMFLKLSNSHLAFACGETSFHDLFFRQIATIRIIPKHKLIVFPSVSWSDFGILQSIVFRAWAWRWGLRREFRLVFSPKRCARTFPRPTGKSFSQLERTANKLNDVRERLMLERNSGLTDLFYEFCDPNNKTRQIDEWRQAQIEVDRSALSAFGWDDIDLRHDFYAARMGHHFTISEPARREVLQRLLKLNHERYEDEVARGLHKRKKGKRKNASAGKPKEARRPQPLSPTLFGDGEDDG